MSSATSGVGPQGPLVIAKTEVEDDDDDDCCIVSDTPNVIKTLKSEFFEMVNTLGPDDESEKLYNVMRFLIRRVETIEVHSNNKLPLMELLKAMINCLHDYYADNRARFYNEDYYKYMEQLIAECLNLEFDLLMHNVRRAYSNRHAFIKFIKGISCRTMRFCKLYLFDRTQNLFHVLFRLTYREQETCKRIQRGLYLHMLCFVPITDMSEGSLIRYFIAQQKCRSYVSLAEFRYLHRMMLEKFNTGKVMVMRTPMMRAIFPAKGHTIMNMVNDFIKFPEALVKNYFRYQRMKDSEIMISGEGLENLNNMPQNPDLIGDYLINIHNTQRTHSRRRGPVFSMCLVEMDDYELTKDKRALSNDVSAIIELNDEDEDSYVEHKILQPEKTKVCVRTVNPEVSTLINLDSDSENEYTVQEPEPNYLSMLEKKKKANRLLNKSKKNLAITELKTAAPEKEQPASAKDTKKSVDAEVSATTTLQNRDIAQPTLKPVQKTVRVAETAEEPKRSMETAAAEIPVVQGATVPEQSTAIHVPATVVPVQETVIPVRATAVPVQANVPLTPVVALAIETVKGVAKDKGVTALEKSDSAPGTSSPLVAKQILELEKTKPNPAPEVAEPEILPGTQSAAEVGIPIAAKKVGNLTSQSKVNFESEKRTEEGDAVIEIKQEINIVDLETTVTTTHDFTAIFEPTSPKKEVEENEEDMGYASSPPPVLELETTYQQATRNFGYQSYREKYQNIGPFAIDYHTTRTEPEKATENVVEMDVAQTCPNIKATQPLIPEHYINEPVPEGSDVLRDENQEDVSDLPENNEAASEGSDDVAQVAEIEGSDTCEKTTDAVELMETLSPENDINKAPPEESQSLNESSPEESHSLNNAPEECAELPDNIQGAIIKFSANDINISEPVLAIHNKEIRKPIKSIIKKTAKSLIAPANVFSSFENQYNTSTLELDEGLRGEVHTTLAEPFYANTDGFMDLFPLANEMDLLAPAEKPIDKPKTSTEQTVDIVSPKYEHYKVFQDDLKEHYLTKSCGVIKGVKFSDKVETKYIEKESPRTSMDVQVIDGIKCYVDPDDWKVFAQPSVVVYRVSDTVLVRKYNIKNLMVHNTMKTCIREKLNFKTPRSHNSDVNYSGNVDGDIIGLCDSVCDHSDVDSDIQGNESEFDSSDISQTLDTAKDLIPNPASQQNDKYIKSESSPCKIGVSFVSKENRDSNFSHCELPNPKVNDNLTTDPFPLTNTLSLPKSSHCETLHPKLIKNLTSPVPTTAPLPVPLYSEILHSEEIENLRTYPLPLNTPSLPHPKVTTKFTTGALGSTSTAFLPVSSHSDIWHHKVNKSLPTESPKDTQSLPWLSCCEIPQPKISTKFTAHLLPLISSPSLPVSSYSEITHTKVTEKPITYPVPSKSTPSLPVSSHSEIQHLEVNTNLTTQPPKGTHNLPWLSCCEIPQPKINAKFTTRVVPSPSTLLPVSSWTHSEIPRKLNEILTTDSLPLTSTPSLAMSSHFDISDPKVAKNFTSHLHSSKGGTVVSESEIQHHNVNKCVTTKSTQLSPALSECEIAHPKVTRKLTTQPLPPTRNLYSPVSAHCDHPKVKTNLITLPLSSKSSSSLVLSSHCEIPPSKVTKHITTKSTPSVTKQLTTQLLPATNPPSSRESSHCEIRHPNVTKHVKTKSNLCLPVSSHLEILHPKVANALTTQSVPSKSTTSSPMSSDCEIRHSKVTKHVTTISTPSLHVSSHCEISHPKVRENLSSQPLPSKSTSSLHVSSRRKIPHPKANKQLTTQLFPSTSSPSLLVSSHCEIQHSNVTKKSTPSLHVSSDREILHPKVRKSLPTQSLQSKSTSSATVSSYSSKVIKHATIESTKSLAESSHCDISHPSVRKKLTTQPPPSKSSSSLMVPSPREIPNPKITKHAKAKSISSSAVCIKPHSLPSKSTSHCEIPHPKETTNLTSQGHPSIRGSSDCDIRPPKVNKRVTTTKSSLLSPALTDCTISHHKVTRKSTTHPLLSTNNKSLPVSSHCEIRHPKVTKHVTTRSTPTPSLPVLSHCEIPNHNVTKQLTTHPLSSKSTPSAPVLSQCDILHPKEAHHLITEPLSPKSSSSLPVSLHFEIPHLKLTKNVQTQSLSSTNIPSLPSSLHSEILHTIVTKNLTIPPLLSKSTQSLHVSLHSGILQTKVTENITIPPAYSKGTQSLPVSLNCNMLHNDVPEKSTTNLLPLKSTPSLPDAEITNDDVAECNLVVVNNPVESSGMETVIQKKLEGITAPADKFCAFEIKYNNTIREDDGSDFDVDVCSRGDSEDTVSQEYLSPIESENKRQAPKKLKKQRRSRKQSTEINETIVKTTAFDSEESNQLTESEINHQESKNISKQRHSRRKNSETIISVAEPAVGTDDLPTKGKHLRHHDVVSQNDDSEEPKTLESENNHQVPKKITKRRRSSRLQTTETKISPKVNRSIVGLEDCDSGLSPVREKAALKVQESPPADAKKKRALNNIYLKEAMKRKEDIRVGCGKSDSRITEHVPSSDREAEECSKHLGLHKRRHSQNTPECNINSSNEDLCDGDTIDATSILETAKHGKRSKRVKSSNFEDDVQKSNILSEQDTPTDPERAKLFKRTTDDNTTSGEEASNVSSLKISETDIRAGEHKKNRRDRKKRSRGSSLRGQTPDNEIDVDISSLQISETDALRGACPSIPRDYIEGHHMTMTESYHNHDDCMGEATSDQRQTSVIQYIQGYEFEHRQSPSQLGSPLQQMTIVPQTHNTNVMVTSNNPSSRHISELMVKHTPLTGHLYQPMYLISQQLSGQYPSNIPQTLQPNVWQHAYLSQVGPQKAYNPSVPCVVKQHEHECVSTLENTPQILPQPIPSTYIKFPDCPQRSAPVEACLLGLTTTNEPVINQNDSPCPGGIGSGHADTSLDVRRSKINAQGLPPKKRKITSGTIGLLGTTSDSIGLSMGPTNVGTCEPRKVGPPPVDGWFTGWQGNISDDIDKPLDLSKPRTDQTNEPSDTINTESIDLLDSSNRYLYEQIRCNIGLPVEYLNIERGLPSQHMVNIAEVLYDNPEILQQKGDDKVRHGPAKD